MNRPIIKGTTHHKASIAKAKAKATSIVSQTRTQSDASLIGAADSLGKSFTPGKIEYGVNMDAFKVPEGDDKTKVFSGKKKPKKEKTRNENLKEEYSKDFPDGTLFPNDSGGYQYYDADGKLVSNKVYDKDGNLVKKEKGKTGKKIVDGVKTVVGGVAAVPVAIGYGLFKVGEYVVDKIGNIVEDNRKVKGPKEPKEPKVKKDTWYNDVDEDGNVISRGYQSIKDKIKAKREQKELDFQAQQEENERIKAEEAELARLKQEEEDANYVGEGEQEVLVKNYKGSKEELAYLEEQKKLADAAKKKQMSKKEVIEVEKPIVGAVGEAEIRNYTSDEQKRLQTEGVFNEEVGRVILPEEQDKDGKFIGVKETQILESDKFSGDNQTNKEVVEENKTSTTTEPVVEKKNTTNSSGRNRRLDLKYKLAGPSVRANMEADGYVPPGVTQVQQQKVFNDWKKDNNIPKGTKLTKEQIEKFSEYESNVDYTKVEKGKSPAAMRDNRIYRNAIKGGVVQQNMIKSGYIPE